MPTKKKDKKRKGKKRAAAKGKRLPTAVQGLLQYLGGQDATLQQTPRPRGAASADSGDTLSRYLAAKTEVLNAVRQQQSGIALSQQLEQQYIAKREKEESEKKISMLSAGLKQGDEERKRAIEQQKQRIANIEAEVRQQGLNQLFRGIQQQKMEREQLGLGSYMGSLSGSTPSRGSGNSPTGNTDPGDWRTISSASVEEPYDPFAVQVDFTGQNIAMPRNVDVSMRAPAAEMYLEQQPTGRPIIRDKPTARGKAVAGGGGAAARPRNLSPPKVTRPVIKAEPKSAGISAEELRSSIAQATGVAKSRIKLPPRNKYAAAQSVLSGGSGSSADVISALKELGITLAEKPVKV